MRNGFNSSRGAMRGTIGGAFTVRLGTAGFATVAIRFGPFLCLESMYLLRTFELLRFLTLPATLRAGGNLQSSVQIFVPAFGGAEVQDFSVLFERQGETFGH